MKFKINDIIYTKDGRKSGNLTVIDETDKTYLVISDYGNILPISKSKIGTETYLKQFFATTGYAEESHKYHNYKEYHPEMFI